MSQLYNVCPKVLSVALFVLNGPSMFEYRAKMTNARKQANKFRQSIS